MPWKHNFDPSATKITFSGPLALWIQEFHSWYEKDLPNSSVPEWTYNTMLARAFAELAGERWNKELLGKAKAKRLEVFLDQNYPSIPTPLESQIFDLMDFLAENIDENQRNQLAPVCRKRVLDALQPPVLQLPSLQQTDQEETSHLDIVSDDIMPGFRRINIACPECRHTLTCDICIVLDGDQYPDLLESAKTDSLFQSVCPNCHSPVLLDHPILIYRPDESPHLVFYPGEVAPLGEEMQQVQTYLDLLKDLLGERWQDSLSEQGDIVPMRELISATLLGSAAIEAMSQSDPLLLGIQNLLSADTLDDEAKILAEHPELVRQGVMRFLASVQRNSEFPGGDLVAARAAERLTLLQDCNILGTDEAIQIRRVGFQAAAIEQKLRDLKAQLTTEQVQQYINLYNSATSIEEIMNIYGGKNSIYQEMIRVAKEKDKDAFSVPSEFQDLWSALNQAADDSDYKAPNELNRRISVWQQLLNSPDFQSSPQVFRVSALNHYIGDLLRRFDVIGDPRDLEQSISVSKDALDQAPLASAIRAEAWYNNGIALRRRYETRGNVKDLSDALDSLNKASIISMRRGDSNALHSSGMGIAYSDIFRLTGGMSNLIHAIEWYRIAVHASSRFDTAKSQSLTNLGSALITRYDHNGDLSDLEEAIHSFEDALSLELPNYPDKNAILTNLAKTLQLRFSHTKNSKDHERAKELYEQANRLIPINAPRKALEVINQALELMATYSETRNLDHLNQAIDLLQQAIARLPSSTPDYAECTGQLGKAISWRYVHSHQISDLEQAIQVLELSNRITPTISPNKLDRECDLGINLYWRYNIAKDPKDLSAAQSHLRDACIDGVYTNPDAVLTTSIIWGQNAVAHLAWSEATEAYTYALQATSALFRIQLSRDKKELWLAKAKRLPELAAYAFAKSGQLQSAVLALEMGRTRLLSEALNRDTARLKGLASSHPKLFIRYREIVNNLDSHQGKISSDTVVLPDLVQEVRAKTHELDSIINEIRQVNGYKDFLRESTWDDIKEVVLPGQPVVYFVTLTQYTGNLALLLRRQNPSNEVIIEPLWLDTFTNVDLLRAVFLSSNQLNQEDAKHRTAEHLDVTFAFLGDNILKPIAKRLHELGTREIVFVPSGVLGSLPLGAGRYSIDGKERYFLDEFDLALTPSLRVLSLSRAKLSSHHIDSPTLVGLANPLDHPSPLPYARVELEEIAKYYERGSRSALYEHQATKNALLEALPNADYIHFACHGEFKENEPMDSCLELANGEVLAIREILQLPHLERARLVVLSACQTAITDHANLPDEFVGLPLGFLKAGIPGVIGTLWPVNDLSTTLLTIRFYEYHRVSGYSPSKALRLAQQWLRDLTVEDLSYLGDWYAQREHQVPREAQSSYNLMQRTLKNISVERNPEARPFSQPYYWAPFVFYGV